ncbi:elicitor-responsive protein 1-like isoform X2 [Macadamia integrifolia]|uniref:elicitor-responsive protein 1-like isoform X2 n=1 Tax=Macadamia integrifolia TaxID=60698 RepID=UPI001C4F7298|nr:elicitor-responsive protein 1-like isoform X2 [Macadamia integrifolia]
MVNGILEVLLVDARGLEGTDFLGRMDPYVLIQYKSQERKSSVRRGEGSNPVWNEKFTIRVEYPVADDQCKLFLRIMDKDTFSADDFVGEATIHLKDLIALGFENGGAELHPRKYSVVKTDQTYCGEIRVGFTFTPLAEREMDLNEEELGGWRQSSF